MKKINFNLFVLFLIFVLVLYFLVDKTHKAVGPILICLLGLFVSLWDGERRS